MLIDLTGEIAPGMWHYDHPYFEPEMTTIPSPTWLERPVYSEAIRMPLQSGTYIESGAHCDPAHPEINAYPLSRTVLLPSVAVAVEVPPGGAVTRAMVVRELDRVGVTDPRGMGLLIGTGWDTHWAQPDFTTDCPYFDDDVADLVIESEIALIGGDTPRFENPAAPQGHLRRMFDRDVLLLAPLANLLSVGTATGRLIAAPLRIRGASATPCRAVWLPDAPSEPGSKTVAGA